MRSIAKIHINFCAYNEKFFTYWVHLIRQCANVLGESTIREDQIGIALIQLHLLPVCCYSLIASFYSWYIPKLYYWISWMFITSQNHSGHCVTDLGCPRIRGFLSKMSKVTIFLQLFIGNCLSCSLRAKCQIEHEMKHSSICLVPATNRLDSSASNFSIRIICVTTRVYCSTKSHVKHMYKNSVFLSFIIHICVYSFTRMRLL